MEGIITCSVGLLAFTVLVKFPDEEVESPSVRFLKPEECKAVMQTLDEDRNDVELEPFSLAEFLKPMRDIEVWGFAFIFL